MKAIVILGAAVWSSGPSPALTRRTTHAARLWHAGAAQMIVPCGGLGRFSPAEATVMRALLIDADVSAACIHPEDRSTSTLENLSYAQPILQHLGVETLIIVTDAYHAPRAWLVARALGFRAIVKPPPLQDAHLPTQIRQYARESMALPAYAVRLAWLRLSGRLPL